MERIRNSREGEKAAITIVSAVLLSLLYIAIFCFSEQEAEQSSGISFSVSKHCVELWNSVMRKGWSQTVVEGFARYWEHPIRKLAHFVEYAVMGVLVFGVLSPWMARRKLLFAAIILWVFVSAAGDEIHQLFVAGRYGSFADVLLDTCGGACGAMVAFWIPQGASGEGKKF